MVGWARQTQTNYLAQEEADHVTEFFGEDPGGWGEGEPEGDDGSVDDGPGGETLGNEIDLGGGIKLRIHPEVFRLIMHTPEITARVAHRCAQMCESANNQAVIEGAEYIFVVSNNPANIRARGRVKPGNIKAREDDARNSTLLKALAEVGSDPYPTYEDAEKIALSELPVEDEEFTSIAATTGEGMTTWTVSGEEDEPERR